MSLTPGFFTHARSRPILLAFVAIWLLEAGMNTLYGFKRGGGGIGAIGYAATFLAIAVVAAWLPLRLQMIRGNGAMAWLQRSAIIVPLVMCVVVSQVAGWAVMGVTVADGQAKRDTAAMGRTVAVEKLERDRAARKSLGDQPAPEQIAARIEAELATTIRRTGLTIRDATNDCAEPSAAPGPCQRVAKLRTQFKDAQRAADLDGRIANGIGDVERAPQIAEGAPDVAVVAALTGAPKEDVRFWMTVALVGVIGFFANFGFALAGMGDSGHAGPVLTPPTSTAVVLVPGNTIGSGPGIAAHFPEPTASPVAASTPQQSLPGTAIAETSFTPTAPMVPVKRDHAREITDNLLVFRAAALADHRGGVVPASEVFERYQAWAGPRAIGADAFHTLFPVLTGIALASLADVPHYYDVAFRAHQVAAVN